MIASSSKLWAMRALPDHYFRPVPIPLLVVGLYGAIQGMILYLLSTYAPGEATSHAPPYLFTSLWLGTTETPSIERALMTANIVVALLLWASYHLNRRSIHGRRWVLQLSYLGAALLLASLQQLCALLTESLPHWTLTQIHP